MTKLYPVTREDGKPDRRFTVQKEPCGHLEPRFVLRFCDNFVMQSPFYDACVVRAVGYRAMLRGEPSIINQEEKA